MGDYYSYDFNNKPPQKKPKKKLKILGLILAAICFGLIAAGAFFLITGKNNVADNQERELVESSNSKLDSTSVSAVTTVTDVSDIVENAMPSIVQVTNMSVIEYRGFFGQYYEQEGKESGSGVIISQDNDFIYVATNNHVINNSRSLTITFCDDNAVAAELQGTYPESDLAVVKVPITDIGDATMKAIKIATVGSSDDLKVGEPSIVIGNALGYGQSVTTGVISALDREIQVSGNDGSTHINSLIQTDAAVNPGNSGGALLNNKGELIGIVSAKYSDTSVEGMGYAIPISKAKAIINDLMNYGKVKNDPNKNEDVPEGNGAYLGISGVDVDSKLAYQYNMPEGIYVADVVEGSGADNAGIRKSDLILEVNGKTVNKMTQLQKEIAKRYPGDNIRLTIATSNDGYSRSREITVTLGERTE